MSMVHCFSRMEAIRNSTLPITKRAEPIIWNIRYDSSLYAPDAFGQKLTQHGILPCQNAPAPTHVFHTCDETPLLYDDETQLNDAMTHGNDEHMTQVLRS